MDKKISKKSSFIVLILTVLIGLIESAPAPAPSINHAEVS